MSTQSWTVLRAATVDGGAENALSCESSLQSLNDSDVTITLEWDSDKLTTGHPPSRLHLFSYCINPTNTSLVSMYYINKDDLINVSSWIFYRVYL